jgi:2-oxoglutarate ferredoxin oxidoreductase subunit gamma
LIAGHGGQGVLLLGDFIAYTGMLMGRHVAYTPSYGPETRGGKVRCYVVVSDEEIDSPIVDEPNILIVMNQPSMDFEPTLTPGGLLLYNSSIIDSEPTRSDLRKARIPVTEIADRIKSDLTEQEAAALKDTRVLANSVMFGAFLQLCEPTVNGAVIDRMLQDFLHSKSDLISANSLAIKKGREFTVSFKDSREIIRASDLIPAWVRD